MECLKQFKVSTLSIYTQACCCQKACRRGNYYTGRYVMGEGHKEGSRGSWRLVISGNVQGSYQGRLEASN